MLGMAVPGNKTLPDMFSAIHPFLGKLSFEIFDFAFHPPHAVLPRFSGQGNYFVNPSNPSFPHF